MVEYALAKEQLKGKVSTFVVGTIVMAVISLLIGYNGGILDLISSAMVFSALFYLPFQYGSKLGMGLVARIICGFVITMMIAGFVENLPFILALLYIFGIPGVDILVSALRVKNIIEK